MLARHGQTAQAASPRQTDQWRPSTGWRARGEETREGTAQGEKQNRESAAHGEACSLTQPCQERFDGDGGQLGGGQACQQRLHLGLHLGGRHLGYRTKEGSSREAGRHSNARAGWAA